MALAHWPILASGALTVENRRAEFREMFEHLAEELGSGRASVQARSLGDQDWVELNPSNPSAARIRAILPKRREAGVTVVVGVGTIFEIPDEGGRYTERRSVVEEAEAICRAVLAGRFKERVRLRGDRVTSSKGTLDLPPPITVKWGRMFCNPLQRVSVRDLSYEAY